VAWIDSLFSKPGLPHGTDEEKVFSRGQLRKNREANCIAGKPIEGIAFSPLKVTLIRQQKRHDFSDFTHL
jgi:hypothetical protein